MPNINFYQKKNTVFSIVFMLLLLFIYNTQESSSGTTTITAVDGYIKNGVVTDSAGQIAPYSAKNGKYIFASNPTYPIKLSGGTLEDTNEIFDIEMTTKSGLVLSPITTFIDGDDTIREKLTNKGFSHITSIEDFSVDYININDNDLSKLSQLLYVILRDRALTSAFKAKLDDQESDLSDLFEIAIKTIDESKLTKNTQIASKDFLNFAKDYNGTAVEMENKLKVSKNMLVYADKVSTFDDENTSRSIRDEDRYVSIHEQINDEGATTLNSTEQNNKTSTYNKSHSNTSSNSNTNKEYSTSNGKTAFNNLIISVASSITPAKNNGDVPSLSYFSTYVNDNVPKGTNIGSIDILKKGGTNIKSFVLSDAKNFKIKKNGTIFTNSTLDYTNTKSYGLTVYAINDAGNSQSVDFKVSLYKDKKIKLIDSEIQGVNYETDTGKTGTTNIDGEFPYDTRDKTVTFKLGNLIITKDFDFSKNSDGIILPTDMVGIDRSNTEDENVIKILRVMQSLDDDNNASNGIYISESTKSYLNKNANLVDTKISALKTMVETAGKIFKSEADSRKHYLQTLKEIKVEYTTRPFITVWRTDSKNEDIKIQTSGENYNYTVDWGDGDITIGVRKSIIHRYSNAGKHTIKISGEFPYIKAENNKQLQTITQWGDIEWKSFYKSFKNCPNLDVNAKDTPNLSYVTSTYAMFEKASSLKGNKYFNNWNVSNITDMQRMFSDTNVFNQALDNWDVSNVKNFEYMFNMADTFNQPLNSWNVGNAQYMTGVFQGAVAFNGSISRWNVSNVTDMQNMFSKARAFSNHDLSNWNVKKVQYHNNFITDAGSNNIEPDFIIYAQY